MTNETEYYLDSKAPKALDINVHRNVGRRQEIHSNITPFRRCHKAAMQVVSHEHFICKPHQETFHICKLHV